MRAGTWGRRSWGRTLAVIAAAAVLPVTPVVTGTGPAAAAPAPCTADWITAAAASPTDPSLVDPRLTPLVSGGDQTYRLTVVPAVDGTDVRVRLTNRYRPSPLRVGAATVADKGRGAALASAATPVTFAGKRSVTLAPGADVLSDPVGLPVTGGEPLAVSVHVAGAGLAPTGHFNANTTSYYTPPGSGDAAGDRSGARYTLTTTSRPIVSGVDVRPTRPAATVVAFGDSITDGYVANSYFTVPEDPSVVDRRVRYPDFLQRRLDADGQSTAVVNAGISGNLVTESGTLPMFGPSGLSRLDRDVLDLDGVSDVLLLEGANDLATPAASDHRGLVASYTAMITRLHRAGKRVHLGTMTPMDGSWRHGLASPQADAERRKINRWIRGQKLSDSVIDFDRAVRDPGDSSVLAAKYSGPDRVHPNAAGYRAMAAAVDLDALAGAACRG